jgi:CDGSH-type Zn-finger protein
MTGWIIRLARRVVAPHNRFSNPAAPVTITPYPDGPLLVRGPFTLQQHDGTLIDPGRHTVALCRCGKSATKPFCDGTHKVSGFTAGTPAAGASG